METKDHIIVAGGYGHVGQTICRVLGERFPGKVFAAGRSYERAEQFCLSTGGKVKPMQLDVNEGVAPEIWEHTKLVIMCLDQMDTTFASTCLENGIHYMDISANYAFLSQVERLHAAAEANRATAILSVGLTPGLSNLMASHASSLMEETREIHISIMLGLGDEHGQAAIEWTVDQLGGHFPIVQQGDREVVASFTNGRKTDFGAGIGRRTAYRFNFSDQHILTKTLGVPVVSTRLCFDSGFVTNTLALMRRVGIFHLLKIRPIRNAVVHMLGKTKLGADKYAVKVDAFGSTNQQNVHIECMLSGKREAYITARAAAAVAEHVYAAEPPHGVFHIEQLFDLNSMLPQMQDEIYLEIREFFP